MDDLDMKINTRLLDEFSLELGDRRRVYDRETGDIRTMKGKEIVAPGCIPGAKAIEFDPINNTRMMNFFFGSYVNALEQDDLLGGDVLSYHTIASNVPGKIKAVLKINPHDGGPIKEINSAPYKNETSCYADLVCRINGSEDTDMTEFDIDRKRGPINPTQPMKFGQVAPYKKRGKK